MAYNNNYNSNYGGRSNYRGRSSYGGRSYGNSYGSRSGGYSNQPAKKRSGCKRRTYYNSEGLEQHLVTGWKVSKRHGLVAIKAVTTKKSELSDKGWYGSVAVTFTVKDTGQKQFYWATMQKSTGKVVINDLGWVLSPNGGHGGYCGKFTK